MWGLGVSVTARPSTFRVIVSATSENVASMGASGLWTVTRAQSTRAAKRQTSAMRWASVSIRSTGSVSTQAFTCDARLP